VIKYTAVEVEWRLGAVDLPSESEEEQKVGLSARQPLSPTIDRANICRKCLSSADFPHTAIKVVEVLTQLLERKAQHKDAFDGVHRQIAR